MSKVIYGFGIVGGESYENESLSEVYKMYRRYKDDDKANHITLEYYFYKQNITPHPDKPKTFIAEEIEGKIYRRGNNIFFKPL